jgi:predicted nucleotidyltransferase
MLQEISSDSVKIISIHRDELLRALEEISLRICQENPEVKEVRLFGSVGRGDQVGVSDVDILVIESDAGPSDPLKAALKYTPAFDLPLGVDLLVLGQAQVEKRLSEGDPFLERIFAESLVLATAMDVTRGKLAARRQQHLLELEAETQRLTEVLVEIGVQRVVQFGSTAQGKAGLASDVDLVVVWDTPLAIPERSVALVRRLQPQAPVDMLVYTPEEFERLKEQAFLRKALAEGKVLYEA